jgi:hypothetical protein
MARQLNFGRNRDGMDTMLITADHLLDDHGRCRRGFRLGSVQGAADAGVV